MYAGLLLALAWAGGVAAQVAPAQGAGATSDERVAALRRVLADYGGLTRYGSENSELPPPRAGERRVVFFGDDATERWQDPRTVWRRTLCQPRHRRTELGAAAACASVRM